MLDRVNSVSVMRAPTTVKALTVVLILENIFRNRREKIPVMLEFVNGIITATDWCLF